METEAVWCSKLFETVKEITGFTPVAEQHLHVGKMQMSETTLGTIPGTHFFLFSSTTLTYGTNVLCCTHSFLLGLLTKRDALRGWSTSTLALFLKYSNVANRVFSLVAFPDFALQSDSLSTVSASSHHPLCGNAKCMSWSAPFPRKWRAFRVTHFKPGYSQIRK